MTDKPALARLPAHVVPEKYFIDYELIDLMQFRFEASERIRVLVKQATRAVTCHAAELQVFNVSAELPQPDGSTKTLACEQIQYVPTDETVTFVFSETLPQDAVVTIALQFHGFLNDKLRGFYRVEYDHENERRVLATTQFEACDARRAFVCWDEPAFKARYEISMVTDPSLTALSNMHVVETKVRPTKNAHLRKLTRADKATEKLWQFAETPIMSTYLVAMVVGEFDVVSDVSAEGVIVNVLTPPGQSQRGRFSLDVGTRALSFFTKRFGIPYPLKKLDMVAVPDFLGAMENWGLVTYAENYLLVDEELTSHEAKVDTARTVCHEISHQWFGNLVTMDWWTGLWLNEGFAQYMEFDAVDALFPQWRVWESFVQEVALGSALVRDSMLSSHPVEVIVKHASEVDEIFDAISYHKGASVVRMLGEFLGRDAFYAGVHDYLVKHSYGNTETKDLWDALERVSGQKITQMASTWTTQTGYPLLTLEQDAQGHLTLRQERFFRDPAMKKLAAEQDKQGCDEDATVWDVPLTMVTSARPDHIERLGIWDAKSAAAGSAIQTPIAAPAELNAKLTSAANGASWIKLNPNQSSFYLVNYPPAMWKQLQEPVRNQTLGVVDRMSLLHTAFTLAGVGVLSVADALDFAAAYRDEPEFLCWKELSSHLERYNLLFGDEAFYPAFQRYVRELFAAVMQRLTWEPTDEDRARSDTAEFRAIVIARLGAAGDESVIREAQRRFALYVDGGDKSALPADLRGVVFRICARNVGSARDAEKFVEQLQRLYEASALAEEKDDCLAAMGSVSDIATQQRVMEWGVANAKTQNLPYVFAGVARAPAGGATRGWSYLKSRYAELNTRFSPLAYGRIVCAALNGFRSQEQADEAEAFLKTQDTSGNERRITAVLETVRLRGQEATRIRDALAQWLETPRN
ncbi:hypothetical protein PINS_up023022 [Pythium insidiosum]|nr:hypothetical protein PINS_up023022 [Pythium insidiosum]